MADGSPHPDAQICIMNARCIALIAQDRGNWAPAGDNLFIDLDLTPTNTPPGTRLANGTAVIEIIDTPHNGCDKFIRRYGRDARLFVNSGEGKRLRLRGIYGRVAQDGRVSVDDAVRKQGEATSAQELKYGSRIPDVTNQACVQARPSRTGPRRATIRLSTST